MLVALKKPSYSTSSAGLLFSGSGHRCYSRDTSPPYRGPQQRRHPSTQARV